MYFGMFGSIFLLAQFFQTAQGYSPLEAGLRMLPWTAMPMVVAPIAGALSDRIGGRPLMAVGLALQAIGLAWIAAVSEADVGYSSLVGPFILSGIGMGCSSRRSRTSSSARCGRARRARRPAPTTRSARSAASSASRCSRRSSPASAATSRRQTFTDGLVAAIWVGAAVVGIGALLALLVPGKQRADARVGRLEAA